MHLKFLLVVNNKSYVVLFPNFGLKVSQFENHECCTIEMDFF